MVLLPGRVSSEQTEQVRKTRTWLLENIRNDWSYPNAPHPLPFSHSVATPPTVSASNAASGAPQDARDLVNQHIRQTPTASNTQLADRLPVAWRERYYSDGEDSASDNDDDHAPSAFDTPDSVGTDLEARKQRRRQRRQQRFDDEMKENIGLAHWSAQRNTWTGANSQSFTVQGPPATESVPLQAQASQTPSPVAATNGSSTLAYAIPDTDLKVPVAQPLLPDNAIRSRITTSSYSDIYTKIVLQGRTPSIPINLTDMTRSLVQGWKEEGQWPPKPTPAEPSLVKKNGHPHIKGGLNKLGRVFGLKGQGLPVEKGPAQGQV